MAASIKKPPFLIPFYFLLLSLAWVVLEPMHCPISFIWRENIEEVAPAMGKTSVHVCVYMCVHVCMCMCVCVCVRLCPNSNLNACWLKGYDISSEGIGGRG